MLSSPDVVVLGTGMHVLNRRKPSSRYTTKLWKRKIVVEFDFMMSSLVKVHYAQRTQRLDLKEITPRITYGKASKAKLWNFLPAIFEEGDF
jgi:hypothetical protein